MASDRRIVDVKFYKMNDLKTLLESENHRETCSYLKIRYSLFVFVNSSVLSLFLNDYILFSKYSIFYPDQGKSK